LQYPDLALPELVTSMLSLLLLLRCFAMAHFLDTRNKRQLRRGFSRLFVLCAIDLDRMRRENTDAR
jgi:hypothetical protein